MIQLKACFNADFGHDALRPELLNIYLKHTAIPQILASKYNQTAAKNGNSDYFLKLKGREFHLLCIYRHFESRMILSSLNTNNSK